MRAAYFGNGISKLRKFREAMGLKVRSSIFVWSFQPAKRELKDLPVFFFADLVRFPTGVLFHKYPIRYFKFLIHFWKYKNNVRSKSWSSLTMIYHRPFVLWYYYSLFWWAEYCGVLPELIEHPNRSLIAELFMRYIVKIDSIIDSKDGREYLLGNIPFIKRNCADILKELLVHIGENRDELHKKSGRMLAHTIWKFRQSSLSVSRNAERQTRLSYDDLLDYKEKTAGELSRVWVDLLCEMYPVERRAENSRKILGWIAMAIQVIDDMLDSPVDYRDNVRNIFIHMLMETTDEFNTATAHFEQFPCQHLDWVWANKHLPVTCTRAVNLLTCHLRNIAAISENQSMTSEMCEILADWRILRPKGQAESEYEMSKVFRGESV